MNEPLYEYVKGKGWFISEPVESLEFESHGNRWLVLARKPRLGEMYTYSGASNHIYVNERDGTPKLDQWASKYLQYNDPSHLKVFGSPDAKMGSETAVYVTVIPYD